MKKQFKYLCIALIILSTSCKDDDPITIPTSQGTMLSPNVGGENQPNQVFIDLSNEATTEVQRDAWDLAFYSGTENYVSLNASKGALAYKTTKTSLDQVTELDTVGLSNQLSLDAIFAALISPQPPAWLAQATSWVDQPDGDLANNAIKEIEADQVYILNAGKMSNGTPANWYKIKVEYLTNGYRLNYDLINGANTQTADITKNAEYNFQQFSFTTSNITLEPKKQDWDLVFTTHTDYAFFGFNVPYFFRDVVLSNRNGVEVSEVVIGAGADLLTEFEAFDLVQSGTLDFSADVNAIGANWRTVQTNDPTTTTGVKTDRFYVVNDVDGNMYKFLFTKMLSNTGERGFPEFTYELMN